MAFALVLVPVVASGVPGPHVVIGSGIDLGTGIPFSVAATEQENLGSHGNAAVGSDTFEVECLTVRDFETFHIATFAGEGQEGSYFVNVVTATATGTPAAPTFHVTKYEGGDPCDLGNGSAFLVGRGAFFIGPEAPLP